jgi:hypothetical protein
MNVKLCPLSVRTLVVHAWAYRTSDNSIRTHLAIYPGLALQIIVDPGGDASYDLIIATPDSSTPGPSRDLLLDTHAGSEVVACNWAPEHDDTELKPVFERVISIAMAKASSYPSES